METTNQQAVEAQLRQAPHAIIQHTQDLIIQPDDSIRIVSSKKENNLDRGSLIVKQKAQGEPVKKTCRICLDQEGKFVAPCICSGSMRYVHYKCLQNWLLKLFQNKIAYSQFKKSKCEVCSTQYNFKSERQRHLDFQYFKNNYHNARQSYIQFGLVMLLLLVVMLGTIVVLGLTNSSQTSIGQKIRAYLLTTSESDLTNFNIILASVCIIIASSIVISTVIFIFEYGVRVEVKIFSIENFARIKGGSRKAWEKQKVRY